MVYVQLLVSGEVSSGENVVGGEFYVSLEPRSNLISLGQSRQSLRSVIRGI
jgi:hypothetical protein